MFYFKITVNRGLAPIPDYCEALKPFHIGEKVAALLASREVKRVVVEPISQAAYMRATRGE